MTSTLARASNQSMSVDSEVLGSVHVPQDEFVEFSAGVFGFPDAKRWVLLPTPRQGLYWLQSADYSALAFLLVDPFACFPGRYQIDVAPAELARLQSPSPQDILVLAIVTMPARRGDQCTANLQAPVLFNLHDRHALQSIRSDDGFTVREAFDIDQFAVGTP